MLQVVIMGERSGISPYPFARDTPEIQRYMMTSLQPFFEEFYSYRLFCQPGFEQFMRVFEPYRYHVRSVIQLLTPDDPPVNGEAMLLHHETDLELHAVGETVGAPEQKSSAANILGIEAVFLSTLLLMLH
jgi:hypothetical protein